MNEQTILATGFGKQASFDSIQILMTEGQAIYLIKILATALSIVSSEHRCIRLTVNHTVGEVLPERFHTITDTPAESL